MKKIHHTQFETPEERKKIVFLYYVILNFLDITGKRKKIFSEAELELGFLVLHYTNLFNARSWLTKYLSPGPSFLLKADNSCHLSNQILMELII